MDVVSPDTAAAAREAVGGNVFENYTIDERILNESGEVPSSSISSSFSSSSSSSFVSRSAVNRVLQGMSSQSQEEFWQQARDTPEMDIEEDPFYQEMIKKTRKEHD